VWEQAEPGQAAEAEREAAPGHSAAESPEVLEPEAEELASADPLAVGPVREEREEQATQAAGQAEALGRADAAARA